MSSGARELEWVWIGRGPLHTDALHWNPRLRSLAVATYQQHVPPLEQAQPQSLEQSESQGQGLGGESEPEERKGGIFYLSLPPSHLSLPPSHLSLPTRPRPTLSPFELANLLAKDLPSGANHGHPTTQGPTPGSVGDTTPGSTQGPSVGNDANSLLASWASRHNNDGLHSPRRSAHSAVFDCKWNSTYAKTNPGLTFAVIKYQLLTLSLTVGTPWLWL